MDNETILVMALEGDYEAKSERLRREIMSTDQVEWAEADKKFLEIEEFARSGRSLLKVPFYTGAIGSLLLAVGSIPMVFHENTARFFNEKYVTTGPEHALHCFLLLLDQMFLNSEILKPCMRLVLGPGAGWNLLWERLASLFSVFRFEILYTFLLIITVERY
jgi:hypothetical protein